MKNCMICGDPVGDAGEDLAFENQVTAICDSCADLIAAETDTQDIGEISNAVE